MRLSDLSINRAVTFSMIFIAVAAFGVVSLLRLSPELLPDITFPVASIITSYEGIGPVDLEKLIARPMEEDEEGAADEIRDDRPSYEDRRDEGPGYRQEGESRGPYGDRGPPKPWRFGDRREEYRRGPPSGRWSGRRGRD